MDISKIRIFDYDNYRRFLNDVYLQNKDKNPKFSFRFFARAAGYKSPSILQEIVGGKKNLSMKGVDRFAKALKLNHEESDFFRNLVLLDQAVSADEKLKYAEEITKSRTYRKIYPLAESQLYYFKHWYFTAVREIVGLPGFKEDPSWIAKRIVPSISADEAKWAIEELLKLGLLERDQEGKLLQTQINLTTADEVSSSYVTGWHKEYLKRASESIDTLPREERDISAIYFPYTKENLIRIKEMIHEFRKEVLEMGSQRQKSNSIYQLNLQLFPIVKVEGEDS